MTFQSVARSHAGDVRELNEDRFLERADVGLWAVADGMGGHHAGSVASGVVVDRLAQVQTFGTRRAALDGVLESIRAANLELLERARSLPGHGVIGSTVVVLLVHEANYACFWAGDSRAYLLRDRKLQQLTNDHSIVQQLVENGRLSAAQAKNHPRSNVVTRAVGAAGEVRLDGRHAAVNSGDTFLLCSDGLSNVVDKDEIASHLAAGSIETAADDLMALSLRRGAPDNVTLVVVRVTQA